MEKKTRERNIYPTDNNTFGKKLKMALVSQDLTVKKFCEEIIEVAQSNFSNKSRRNNFSESEMRYYCDKLGYDVEITLVNRETGERI